MQPGRLLAIIGVIAPLTLPTVTIAQGSSGLQLFSAYDNSFPGGAGLAGVGLSVGAGPVGVRGTFGLALSTFSSSANGTTPVNAGRWTGDADLVLGGVNLLGFGGLLGGVVKPYAFAGIGAHSASGAPSFTAAAKTWSYGGGIALPISSTISLAGEMRNRSSLGSMVPSAADFVSGTEFRIGLDLKFGGAPKRSTPVSSTRSGGGRSSSPGTIWPTGAVNSSGAARRVVPDAERFLGVPYLYGGSTPKAFDCSGLVQYVYRQEGVELPRTSRQMAGSGIAIDRSAMAVGDLMLFAQGGEVSHVAIYAGNGRFIHSTSSGGGVRYDDLNTQRGSWFATHLVAIRRVATGAGPAAAAFAKSFVAFDHFDPPDSAPPVIKKR